VDDIVNVSEDEVREAMRQLVLRGRVVAEPSGAASFAALLFHSQQLPRAKRYVAIISGGNTEPAFLADVIAAHPGSAPAAV
jgi:threonine dehydratase